MRRLLAGPSMVGFASWFDSGWGKPCAPADVPTVIPTAIGGVPLPFSCPHCGAVRPVMADPKKRERFRDPWRNHFWCPACLGRYRLDAAATPPAPIEPGSAAAPARVVIGGQTYLLPVSGAVANDLDMLGT